VVHLTYKVEIKRRAREVSHLSSVIRAAKDAVARNQQKLKDPASGNERFFEAIRDAVIGDGLTWLAQHDITRFDYHPRDFQELSSQTQADPPPGENKFVVFTFEFEDLTEATYFKLRWVG
jgi:hypothetical protein